MANYYRVLVKYEETHEVLVSAKDIEEAKEKAMHNWQAYENQPIAECAYVYDVNELKIGENHG